MLFRAGGNWIVGPTKVDLGDFAEISVPEGYCFLSANDARQLLGRKNNPVPKDLGGMLAPVSMTWAIVFEASDIGYVRDSKKELDTAAILKEVRESAERQNREAAKMGGGVINLVDWEAKPVYNRAQHSIEWTVRAQSGPVVVLNHAIRLLGRRGSIVGIAVQSSKSEAIPLNELMQGISFKPGQSYDDFQKGDRIARYSPGDLVVFNEKANANSASFIWIIAVSAGIVCVGGIGVGVWAWRRKKRVAEEEVKNTAPLIRPMRPLAAAPAPAPAAAAPVTAVAPRTNGTVTAKAALPPTLASGGARVNGKRNGYHSGVKRKRIFNYQKYYSDLMLQVSDRAYELGSPLKKPNGTPASTNGSTPAHKPAAAAEPAPSPMDLIATQKNLIEEQQRLIREQTRLIEEKSKLIQEKSQLIDKQTELFGNGIY